MRYQDRIYIQTANTCVRNKDHINVNMSSDICIFVSPTFTMNGAGKIQTGITTSDSLVHIVETGTTIDLTFTFTGNVETFNTVDTTFKYQVYKFDNPTNVFVSPKVYQSADYGYSSFSGTSAFTDSIATSVLNIDGEYLVKGNYDFTICTDIMNKLGETIDTGVPVIGNEYDIYDSEFDYYFVAINKADKPIFALTASDGSRLGALTVVSYALSGETEITAPTSWLGSIIVALNGLTLSNEDDYTTTGNTIILNYPSSAGDILTLSYVNSGNPNGLQAESILVSGPITSGVTDTEGSNVIYYNTDISKYEVYLGSDPLEFNDVIITLNGVTLANGLDYTQSVTNPRRVILAGDIILDDIITMTYNTYGSFAGTILVDIFDIFWTIETPPPNINGQFTVLVGEDNTYAVTAFTTTVPYILNEVSYGATIDLSSYSGTTAAYKVTNEKGYTLISGDNIISTTDSEEILIQISV